MEGATLYITKGHAWWPWRGVQRRGDLIQGEQHQGQFGPLGARLQCALRLDDRVRRGQMGRRCSRSASHRRWDVSHGVPLAVSTTRLSGAVHASRARGGGNVRHAGSREWATWSCGVRSWVCG